MTRLSVESVRMLRDLFAKHAEHGATIFHQAHAEELLAIAEEVIAMRSETRCTTNAAPQASGMPEHTKDSANPAVAASTDKWGADWFRNIGFALRELAKLRQDRDKQWDERSQRLVDWAIDIEAMNGMRSAVARSEPVPCVGAAFVCSVCNAAAEAHRDIVAVKPGWCSVPIEPTQAMLDAGNAADYAASSHRTAGTVWRAMLSAVRGEMQSARALIIEECAKYVELEARSCLPGSSADDQNWGFCLQSVATKMRRDLSASADSRSAK